MNDFNKITIRKLAKKGISIIGKQALPGLNGSFLNPITGYVVDDNGVCKVLTHSDILRIADSK
jgi:hypothetical protein